MGTLLPPPGEPKPLAEGEFILAAPPNVVSFGLQEIGPPSSLYIQRDDKLFINAFTYLPDQTVRIIARLLLAAPPVVGQPATTDSTSASASVYKPASNPIIVIERELPVTALVYTPLLIPLAEGYLLSVGVFAPSTQLRGDTFVRGYIQRAQGVLALPDHALPLFADFVTKFDMAGWPWGRSINPAEGPGHLISSHQAAPAAGADWSVVGSSFGRWKCHTVSSALTTAAGGGNRSVTAEIRDAAGNILYKSDAITTQAGGTTRRYTFATGVTMPAVSSLAYLLPLHHEGWLPFGSILFCVTDGLAAGDQWSTVNAMVEQWAG
jgi:hypothetical protein